MEFTVHGILQARILEWVAIPPGNIPNPEIKPSYPLLQVHSLPFEPPGKSEGLGRSILKRWIMGLLLALLVLFFSIINLFWLEDNYFTILGWFLKYNMNWPQCTTLGHMCPPPTSLPTLSLWFVPEHWLWMPAFTHQVCTVNLFIIW